MKLNSWDVATDEHVDRAEDAGTVEWNGQEWQMLWLPPLGILGLRLASLRHEAPLWRRRSLVAVHGSASQELVTRQEQARVALEERSLTQHFYASQDLERRSTGARSSYLFSLSADGEGLVRILNSQKENALPMSSWFRWPALGNHDWTQECDALAWWRRAREELNNENSDVSYALHFARVPALQKAKLIWPWSEKEQEEVRCVLSWALLAQEELWKQNSTCWQLTVWFDQHDAGHPDRLKFGTSNIPLGLPPSLHRAVEKIKSAYPARRNSEIGHFHCVQKWIAMHCFVFRISIESPTAHERLEAQMRFRDWLATRGA